MAYDIFGVLAIAFAVFALMALHSYNPSDPSFNRHHSTAGEVQNLGGIVGSYLSDGLVQLFGTGALFFPLVTLFFGWTLIRRKTFRRWPVTLSAGFALLVCFCSLLAIHFEVDPWFKEFPHSGGLTGTLIGKNLMAWLNLVGSTLALGTLTFLFFMAMIGSTVNDLLEGGERSMKNALDGSTRHFRERASKIQEWNERRAQRRELIKEERTKREPVIVTRTNEPVDIPVISKKRKKEKVKETETFPVQETLPVAEMGDYQVPPLDLLNNPPPPKDEYELKEEILKSSKVLEDKLADFGILGKVVQVLPGPVITLYEFEPAPGIKVSRILSLSDDLALAMRALSVRFLAPVPGKPVVGIEIPNRKRETVYFKEIISSQDFREENGKLPLVIGKDNIGEPVVQGLAQVPHLLIAGSTGSGKSVGINAMICSLLLNSTPEEVKMIMIDPKMLELSMYDGIPHLIAPVVTNPKKAAAALQWAVAEMETRYKMMAEMGVRNIHSYNANVQKLEEDEAETNKPKSKKKTGMVENGEGELEEALNNLGGGVLEEEPPTKLPYIVVIIDELADLMMVASKGVEDALARLAQMARAAGIHLIVATQRPSVDVLTGVIKANFPARISYQVTSRVDSRTILDSMGAEKLLGKGDMLFLPPGTGKLRRIHGAMVSDEEINRILSFIKQQKTLDCKEEVFAQVAASQEGDIDEEDMDEKYDEAVELVSKEQQASISMIQRRLRVGYNRAARMVEIMEREGVVGPSDGIKPREVYVKPIAFE